MPALVRICLSIALTALLSGCIYEIKSEQQIYATQHLSPIGEREWRVLTALAGNKPAGRSTEVDSEGNIEVTELSEDSLSVSQYANGEVTSAFTISRADELTVTLSSREVADAPRETCRFGVVEVSKDLFVLPSLGGCDGENGQFFVGTSEDERSNGFRFLSFNDDKISQISALAEVHRISMTASKGGILVHEVPSADAFSLFVTDARSTGVLR
ncbi:MAG: hypothetical protein AAGD13_19950 [Pseudomonadota bacterium]